MSVAGHAFDELAAHAAGRAGGGARSAPRSSCAPSSSSSPRSRSSRPARPWREADADVGEAIDFLEYYGREILRLEADGQLAARWRGETDHALQTARRGRGHRPVELPAGDPHGDDDRGAW